MTRLAVLAMLAACGSSHSSPAQPVARSAGLALFEERCETCHDVADPEANRPLLIGRSLDPVRANQSLKRVLLGTMPPGDDHLSRADALALGDWLCAETRRGPEACQTIVHNSRRFAPSLALFLTTALRNSGRSADPETSFFWMDIRNHMKPSVSAQVLDPTMVALASGLAFEACLVVPPFTDPLAPPVLPPPAKPTPDEEKAFAACYAAYLDAMLAPIAPPPPPRTGAAP